MELSADRIYVRTDKRFAQAHRTANASGKKTVTSTRQSICPDQPRLPELRQRIATSITQLQRFSMTSFLGRHGLKRWVVKYQFPLTTDVRTVNCVWQTREFLGKALKYGRNFVAYALYQSHRTLRFPETVLPESLNRLLRVQYASMRRSSSESAARPILQGDTARAF